MDNGERKFSLGQVFSKTFLQCILASLCRWKAATKHRNKDSLLRFADSCNRHGFGSTERLGWLKIYSFCSTASFEQSRQWVGITHLSIFSVANNSMSLIAIRRRPPVSRYNESKTETGKHKFDQILAVNNHPNVFLLGRTLQTVPPKYVEALSLVEGNNLTCKMTKTRHERPEILEWETHQSRYLWHHSSDNSWASFPTLNLEQALSW